MENQICVCTTTINSLWFELLYKILTLDVDGKYLYSYPTGVIQKGSFENEQSRLQFPSISICVEFPLLDRIVTLPETSKLPKPIDEESLDKYFADYILGSVVPENTTYTYGSRVNISLSYVLDMLKETPVTNQAVLEIAYPEDVMNCKGKDGKNDPPCLRLMDIKVVPGYSDGELDRGKSRLDIHAYFRSWDLYAGLPENLGGISMLQEMISEHIGIPVGKLYAYSSGLHLYRYQKALAELRTYLYSDNEF